MHPPPRPQFDPAPTRQVQQWAENVGGWWSDPARWAAGSVPATGDSPYVYQQGPFSTIFYLNRTWDSVRVDGSEGPVVVNQPGNHTLTANEFAVGIFGSKAQGGHWRLGAGTVNAQTAYVGASGVGTFDQSSGRATFGQFLSIGENEGTHGRYELAGGTLQASELDVGYRGEGTLNLFGGNALVAGYLAAGVLEGSAGTVEMISGTLTAGQIYLGLFGGQGLFWQRGGSVLAIDWLDLGEGGETAGGVYLMDAGTLTAGELAIGLNESDAIYNQNGGTVAVGYLYVGPNGDAKLYGGSLSAATIEIDGSLDIGPNGFATTNDCRDAIRVECLQGDIVSAWGVGYDEAHVIATVPGDVDLNRTTNISDFSIIGGNFNKPGFWPDGDVSYDGTVNIADFSIVAAHFNQSFPASRNVPEPAAAIAGAHLLTHRRKRR